jgi:hypothetical protein
LFSRARWPRGSSQFSSPSSPPRIECRQPPHEEILTPLSSPSSPPRIKRTSFPSQQRLEPEFVGHAEVGPAFHLHGATAPNAA